MCGERLLDPTSGKLLRDPTTGAVLLNPCGTICTPLGDIISLDQGGMSVLSTATATGADGSATFTHHSLQAYDCVWSFPTGYSGPVLFSWAYDVNYSSAVYYKNIGFPSLVQSSSGQYWFRITDVTNLFYLFLSKVPDGNPSGSYDNLLTEGSLISSFVGDSSLGVGAVAVAAGGVVSFGGNFTNIPNTPPPTTLYVGSQSFSNAAPSACGAPLCGIAYGAYPYPDAGLLGTMAAAPPGTENVCQPTVDAFYYVPYLMQYTAVAPTSEPFYFLQSNSFSGVLQCFNPNYSPTYPLTLELS